MSEVEYKQEPWSLDDLFPGFDTPTMRRALESLEEQLQAFEAFRTKLSAEQETEAFKEMVQAYEGLTREVRRLHGFSSLSFASDTQDQEAQANLARFQQLAAETHNRILFFELWWKDLEDEQATRLMDSAGDYRYWLEALRLKRPYTLSENEERVINLKNVNGPAALLTLLSTITDRYTFHTYG